VHAHDRGLLERVSHEAPAVRPRDQRTRESPAAVGPVWIVDTQLILVQVDDQLDGPAGQDTFSEVRGSVPIVKPEVVHEALKRRSRNMRTEQHGFDHFLPASRLDMRR
jgi:hypothetical protein